MGSVAESTTAPDELAEALAQAREAVIAAGMLCWTSPDPVMEGMIEAMSALGPLHDVLIIRIEVLKPDTLPTTGSSGKPQDSNSRIATAAVGEAGNGISKHHPASIVPRLLRTPAPTPVELEVERLRADLKRAGWDIRVEPDGRCTLLKGYHRTPIYSSSLEDCRCLSERCIFNTQPPPTLGDLER